MWQIAEKVASNHDPLRAKRDRFDCVSYDIHVTPKKIWLCTADDNQIHAIFEKSVQKAWNIKLNCTVELTNLVTFHDVIIIVKFLYKATSHCLIALWSFSNDCDITFMFKI